MGFLDQFFANDVLHALSQGLLIPTVLLLLLLVVCTVYTIGSLVVEVAVERKHYRAELPKLIARLDAAPYEDLRKVIEGARLLDTQRDALLELVSYMHLPEDALTEVAKQLLSNEAGRYRKALSLTESATKIAPMLGLMGTLIPLGPGIVALSSGDLETLSSSLLVAFDTTVAGLAVAIVCFLVSKVRRRWYEDYLNNVEGVMNTLLEKAEALREQGFVFPRQKGAGFSGRFSAAVSEEASYEQA